MHVSELATPALCVDLDTLDHNLDTMAAARPGTRLRPHVKAMKSTALARHVAARAGHTAWCGATLRELEGLAAAGLGEDLLLANETLATDRLRDLVRRDDTRVTVAVDSVATLDVAAAAGAEVFIDVNVGLPRCGCPPSEAAPLARRALDAGLTVRGVMGYEGHVVGHPDAESRARGAARAMEQLLYARDAVVAEGGGSRTTAGGTGTWNLHPDIDEVQAGSYALMDTAYGRLELPFRPALRCLSTVLSVTDGDELRYAVTDAGLKAFGMDHGNPEVSGFEVFFCSDEHTTLLGGDGPLPDVGDRLWMMPAHVDPTLSYHEALHVIRGDEVLDRWPLDLRGW